MTPRWGWVLALGVLTSATVAACAREAPARQVLRIPLINDPILNPVIAPDIGSVLVNKVIFPGLVRPNESLQPTPDLATHWEISDDGLAYTFSLRSGVTWHDGTPFTAHDVKFTFDQIADLSSGSRLRSDFAAIASVDVVDSLTVRFRLHAPFAPLLTLLGYNAGILPRHLLQGQPLTAATTFNRSTPIGTGPFMVEHVEPGNRITLIRNPRYYGAAPTLDGVTFKIVPDINAQTAQLRAGELDLITIEPANLATVEKAPGISIAQVPVAQHWYVAFNLLQPHFASPLVRQALQLAVNREAIVTGILKGYGDLPQGTIPKVLAPFFDDSLPMIRYAPDSAARLLKAAGWSSGRDSMLVNARGERFAFDLLVDKGNPTREQAALAVQHDLRRVGIDVQIRTMEFAALVRDYVLPGTYEALLIWWTTPPDPDQFAFYATGQDNNHARWSNPVADSLLALGRATSDTAVRRATYRAFQRLQRTDPPVLVLFYPREIQAATTALRGVPKLGIRDALRYSERFSLARP